MRREKLSALVVVAAHLAQGALAFPHETSNGPAAVILDKLPLYYMQRLVAFGGRGRLVGVRAAAGWQLASVPNNQ